MMKEIIENIKKHIIMYLSSINRKKYMTTLRNMSNPIKNVKDGPRFAMKNLYTPHGALLYGKT